MNKRKKPEKLTEEKQRRFREAKRDFQKMQEEIAPFVKRRKFKKYSTEWLKDNFKSFFDHYKPNWNWIGDRIGNYSKL